MMETATKAIIRDDVYYSGEACLRRAPFGEYDIAGAREHRIDFSHGARKAFSLSLDVVLQHVCEGRIALIGGRKLPNAA